MVPVLAFQVFIMEDLRDYVSEEVSVIPTHEEGRTVLTPYIEHTICGKLSLKSGGRTHCMPGTRFDLLVLHPCSFRYDPPVRTSQSLG